MNTIPRLLLSSAILAGLSGCITTSHVTTKVTDGIGMEQYKTFRLHAGEIYDSESGKVSEPSRIRMDLEASVTAELVQRGLTHAENNPDLIFSYVAGRRLRHTDQLVYPISRSTENEWTYQEGAVDLIARDTANKIVWRSHMQAVINPQDRDHRQLKKAIARAFKDYPTIKP